MAQHGDPLEQLADLVRVEHVLSRLASTGALTTGQQQALMAALWRRQEGVLAVAERTARIAREVPLSEVLPALAAEGGLTGADADHVMTVAAGHERLERARAALAAAGGSLARASRNQALLAVGETAYGAGAVLSAVGAGTVASPRAGDLRAFLAKQTRGKMEQAMRLAASPTAPGSPGPPEFPTRAAAARACAWLVRRGYLGEALGTLLSHLYASLAEPPGRVPPDSGESLLAGFVQLLRDLSVLRGVVPEVAHGLKSSSRLADFAVRVAARNFAATAPQEQKALAYRRAAESAWMYLVPPAVVQPPPLPAAEVPPAYAFASPPSPPAAKGASDQPLEPPPLPDPTSVLDAVEVAAELLGQAPVPAVTAPVVTAAAGFPGVAEPRRPSALERIIDEVADGAHWWRGFLVQNVGWLIGALSVVAGFAYVASWAWLRTAESPFSRLWVVLTVLEVASLGVFFLPARHLYAKYKIELTRWVFFTISLLLVPISFALVTEMLVIDSDKAGWTARLLSFLAAAALTAGLAAWIGVVSGAAAHRDLARLVPAGLLGFGAIQTALPLVPRHRGDTGAAVLILTTYMTFGLYWYVLSGLQRRTSGITALGRRYFLMFAGILAFSALVSAGHLHLDAAFPGASSYAPVLVLAGTMLCHLDIDLGGKRKRVGRASRLTIAAYALAVLGYLLAAPGAFPAAPGGGVFAPLVAMIAFAAGAVAYGVLTRRTLSPGMGLLALAGAFGAWVSAFSSTGWASPARLGTSLCIPIALALVLDRRLGTALASRLQRVSELRRGVETLKKELSPDADEDARTAIASGQQEVAEAQWEAGCVARLRKLTRRTALTVALVGLALVLSAWPAAATGLFCYGALAAFAALWLDAPLLLWATFAAVVAALFAGLPRLWLPPGLELAALICLAALLLVERRVSAAARPQGFRAVLVRGTVAIAAIGALATVATDAGPLWPALLAVVGPLALCALILLVAARRAYGQLLVYAALVAAAVSGAVLEAVLGIAPGGLTAAVAGGALLWAAPRLSAELYGPPVRTGGLVALVGATMIAATALGDYAIAVLSSNGDSGLLSWAAIKPGLAGFAIAYGLSRWASGRNSSRAWQRGCGSWALLAVLVGVAQLLQVSVAHGIGVRGLPELAALYAAAAGFCAAAGLILASSADRAIFDRATAQGLGVLSLILLLGLVAAVPLQLPAGSFAAVAAALGAGAAVMADFSRFAPRRLPIWLLALPAAVIAHRLTTDLFSDVLAAPLDAMLHSLATTALVLAWSVMVLKEARAPGVMRLGPEPSRQDATARSLRIGLVLAVIWASVVHVAAVQGAHNNDPFPFLGVSLALAGAFGSVAAVVKRGRLFAHLVALAIVAGLALAALSLLVKVPARGTNADIAWMICGTSVLLFVLAEGARRLRGDEETAEASGHVARILRETRGALFNMACAPLLLFALAAWFPPDPATAWVVTAILLAAGRAGTRAEALWNVGGSRTLHAVVAWISWLAVLLAIDRATGVGLGGDDAMDMVALWAAVSLGAFCVLSAPRYLPRGERHFRLAGLLALAWATGVTVLELARGASFVLGHPGTHPLTWPAIRPGAAALLIACCLWALAATRLEEAASARRSCAAWALLVGFVGVGHLGMGAVAHWTGVSGHAALLALYGAAAGFCAAAALVVAQHAPELIHRETAQVLGGAGVVLLATGAVWGFPDAVALSIALAGALGAAAAVAADQADTDGRALPLWLLAVPAAAAAHYLAQPLSKVLSAEHAPVAHPLAATALVLGWSLLVLRTTSRSTAPGARDERELSSYKSAAGIGLILAAAWASAVHAAAVPGSSRAALALLGTGLVATGALGSIAAVVQRSRSFLHLVALDVAAGGILAIAGSGEVLLLNRNEALWPVIAVASLWIALLAELSRWLDGADDAANRQWVIATIWRHARSALFNACALVAIVGFCAFCVAEVGAARGSWLAAVAGAVLSSCMIAVGRVGTFSERLWKRGASRSLQVVVTYLSLTAVLLTLEHAASRPGVIDFLGSGTLWALAVLGVLATVAVATVLPDRERYYRRACRDYGILSVAIGAAWASFVLVDRGWPVPASPARGVTWIACSAIAAIVCWQLVIGKRARSVLAVTSAALLCPGVVALMGADILPRASGAADIMLGSTLGLAPAALIALVLASAGRGRRGDPPFSALAQWSAVCALAAVAACSAASVDLWVPVVLSKGMRPLLANALAGAVLAMATAAALVLAARRGGGKPIPGAVAAGVCGFAAAAVFVPGPGLPCWLWPAGAIGLASWWRHAGSAEPPWPRTLPAWAIALVAGGYALAVAETGLLFWRTPWTESLAAFAPVSVLIVPSLLAAAAIATLTGADPRRLEWGRGATLLQAVLLWLGLACSFVALAPRAGLGGLRVAAAPLLGALAAILVAWLASLDARRFALTSPRRRASAASPGTDVAFGWLALALVLASVLSPAASAPAAAEQGVFVVTLAASAVFFLRAAVLRHSERLAFVGQALCCALYPYLRGEAELFDAGSFADGVFTLLAAFAFLGLGALVDRERHSVFRRPAMILSATLPILALVTAFETSDSAVRGTAVIALFASLLYAGIGQQLARRWPFYLSASMFNLGAALFWFFTDETRSEAQLYAIPLALSILGLIQVHKADLGPQQLFQLRLWTITGLYLSSTFHVLVGSEQHPLLYPAALAAMSLAGVVMGIVLRIRPFLYAGTAFFALNVVMQPVLYAQDMPRLAWGMMLIGLGGTVLGGMVYLNVRRDQVLARYRELRARLAQWE
ncbi:MAG: hypothetical protein HYV63_16305 [Candidatus Schekmanbacteria bacterium]|nr:hypothetical protein [Candidatus Schekmanbacteria bacterium]